ncbi:feline leukemia virus subgroup C receptor-related protein 2 [Schistocerca piceifrons]|uniref:feline leukemia virus subgroup C receptor-related protein 2 n=1 Tax=Schistocerca piceifrons TaxID=274613 RepID=UPI001F5F6AC6|nr:feline leukemia virus subgroup C receptor-related protein 2 [Schistocerca piceifrons]XP_049937588.1 feline leukemia virus subgroup C receptor-related protein 2 [Schistocerca serialis cubense]
MEAPAATPALPDAGAAAPPACRLYARRWLMLAIFVLCSLSNSIQWIQYSVITNIVTEYYRVDSNAVNWTAMLYEVLYIPLIFPASWILEKTGLRVCLLAGILGTALGSWVKVFSVGRHLFWVGFAGQSIVGGSQIFILSLPARIGAVWFGPDEVSTAVSIGVFGNQLGVALGFLLPPLIVKYHEGDMEASGSEFALMFYLMAGFCTVLLLVVVALFRAAPPTPPSPAQAAQKEAAADEGGGGGGSFLSSTWRLVTNPGFALLLVAYGINVGDFYAISTLLNQVVLQYFPGREVDVGRLGLVMVLAGMVGSVCCGVVLDKTHKYKEVTLAIYFMSLVGLVIYTFTLNCGYIEVVYFTIIFLGFFMTGYLPVGFELAAELTYPEPEGTSAGMLNASVQVFGIAFTLFYAWLFELAGDMWANGALCITLVVGTVITAVIRADLRRQSAQRQHLQPVPLPA